jgi:hypothetical protein
VDEEGWTVEKKLYLLWGDGQKFFEHIGIAGLPKIKAEKILRKLFPDKNKVLERFKELCAECGIEPRYEDERIKIPDKKEKDHKTED